MELNAKRLTAALLGALLLAGCGGAQAPMANSAAAPNSVRQLSEQNQDCENRNLDVNPCHVIFNAKNPGPTDVTVENGNQGGGGKVISHESDDCASAGIATITEDSENHYTVTAGTTMGSCKALFTDHRDDQGINQDIGRQGNGGELHVTNDT